MSVRGPSLHTAPCPHCMPTLQMNDDVRGLLAAFGLMKEATAPKGPDLLIYCWVENWSDFILLSASLLSHLM